MKTLLTYIKIGLFAIIIFLLPKKYYAQGPDWNTSGNIINSAEWFGATNTSSIPIQFRHQANIGLNSRFEWHTNLNGTIGERMRLTANGSLGLNIDPGALLHGHRPSSGENLGFSNLWLTTGLTGTTFSDGLELTVQDISATNFVARLSFNENGPIFVQQNNSPRLVINNGTWTDPLGNVDNDVTRVHIPITNTAQFTPYSALHIGDIAVLGFPVQRPWMNSGTTCTALNFDLMYTGLYENQGDQTDAVISWGCNFSEFFGGPDNLRFIFLGPQDGSGTDAASIAGQEVGRFSPEGNLGVGNFFTNGLNQQPTQRIDADGTARLRNMPNNLGDVIIVGQEQDAVGDYDLNYLAFNGQADQYLSGNGTWQTLANDLLCEWNEGINTEDLVMGYATACHERNVGIGLNNPNAKLDVYRDGSAVSDHVTAENIYLLGTNDVSCCNYLSKGLQVTVTGSNESPGNSNIGVQADVSFSRHLRGGIFNTTAGVGTSDNRGVQSIAAGQSTQACANTGVWGEAKNSPSNARDYGVSGIAVDGSGINIGVHGKVIGGQSSYAGYFEGNVYTVGNIHATGVVTWSDASLKNNISPVENSLDVIMQLSPVS
jgi:hypothetical protein